MNGEVQITDLVISKLLLQNIEKSTEVYFHTLQQLLDITFQELLRVVEIISNVHTGSTHTDPLYRITPAKLISSKDYDREIFGTAPRFS